MDGAKPNATLTTQDVQKTTFTKYTKNPQQRTSLNSSETTSKTRTIEHPYAYAHHRNERDGRGRGRLPSSFWGAAPTSSHPPTHTQLTDEKEIESDERPDSNKSRE
eukprot:TRINITY_DN7652_c0_g1_i1.p2 TRINITY_DN7652_c0_g1~~TRINITY_DN7652_c0_g1_i1.p2  ORF type:complete len:106 (-),score=12.24 TRINITY_DN7652_c0_g1_i1:204-521(-)